ncbi:LuxR family transcriptional regulator [Streptomyces sp. NBC_00457]|uniref:ATP-binding protein n=1 Tax=Streptomyces sp. NBC_00457 TaxID=2975748 RepID=UPI002E1C2AA0
MLDRPGPPRPGEADGLVGRDEELALIRSFVDGAATVGGTLLLTGEPGVGKTELLDFAARTAEAAGSLVLRSAGVEFEADVTYSGLHQILLPLGGEFGLLGAGQRSALSVALGFGVGPAPNRLQVSEAALALLRRAADRQPLVMIVDDLQWLDRASAGVLGFVSRRLADSGVCFLGAARLGTESHFDRKDLPEHELRPLGEEAATDLVRSRFPTLVAGDRVRLVAEAQGNPLALLELAGYEASGPQAAAGSAAPVAGPPVGRLETLFASRVNELPAPTRRLALRLALDATGDPRILQSTGPGEPGPSDLEPAERSGLIRIDGNPRRIVFGHPLIRSAVVKESTGGERRHAHRALAQLLADQPERRAWHLAEASIEPDEQVASLLDEVAQLVLGRGDVVGAVATLLRAAELSPHGSDRSRRLARAAYIGAEAAGDLRSTPRLLAAAHAAAPGSNESLRATTAASYMLLSGEGDIDTAHRLLVGAIEAFSVRDDADDRVLNEAFATLLLVCFFGGRAELWDPFHAAVADFACDRLVSLCASTACDPVRTAAAVLEELDRLIHGSDEEVDPARIVRLAQTALHVDRLAGLRGALWRVARDGRQGGAVASGIHALILLSHEDFMTGRWDDAQRLVDEGLQLCQDHGYGLGALPGRYVKALLAAGRGDFDTAAAVTHDLERYAAPRGLGVARMYVAHARALAALGRGDYEAAYQQTTAISPAGVFASRVAMALRVPMDLVEAAVRSNRQAEADAHVAAMCATGMAVLSPRLALLVAGSAAMAASDSTATALFEEALATPGADRWAFELARVRLAYGEHLRRARAISAARVQLSAARDAFQRMGARPWATRAENELRATGQKRSHGGAVGPGALTSREREIAMLAVSGLSNKQIGERLRLSARTVGAHLRNVFQKLGIASRAALRDALDPRPCEPPDEAGSRGRHKS